MSTWFDENLDRVAFRLELEELPNGGDRIVWHGLEDGQPVTFTKEPHTGFWRRAGVNTMRLLPVESQL